MIVAFGVEMNGEWFPWSGTYYGGDEWWVERAQELGGSGKLQGRVSPRGRSCAGAQREQPQVVVHTTNCSYPLDTWNFPPRPIIRARIVCRLVRPERLRTASFKDKANPDIRSLVDWPYQEMCGLDPKKPIAIAKDSQRRRLAVCCQRARNPQARMDRAGAGTFSGRANSSASKARSIGFERWRGIPINLTATGASDFVGRFLCKPTATASQIRIVGQSDPCVRFREK